MTRTFYTFCFLLLTVLGFSQGATIRGFVYNKDNGEPVAFSNVYLKGTTMGASTDMNGYFSLNKVIPGAYNFHNNGYMVTLGDRIDNDSELSNGTSSHSDSLEVN